MKPYPTIRSFALAALLAISLPPSPSEAVSISLVPDGPTTIEIGETVNLDVFLVLDAADQVSGISAATLHLELGSGLVDATVSKSGSVFPNAAVNVAHGPDFIVFSQYGVTITSPRARLGSLSITGKAKGSYDLVARRFGSFPLFTPPGLGAHANRYDFASDETLLITVTCSTGSCPVASPSPMEPLPPDPPPILPDLPSEEPPPPIPGPPATPPVIPTIIDTIIYTVVSTFTSTETGTFASTLLGIPTSTTQLIPEPSTFALLGVALMGLMLLRSPRRGTSKPIRPLSASPASVRNGACRLLNGRVVT